MRRKKPHDYIRQTQEAFILDYLAERNVTHLRDRCFHDAFWERFGGQRQYIGDGIPVNMAMARLRGMTRRGALTSQWVYAPEGKRMEYRLSAKTIRERAS